MSLVLSARSMTRMSHSHAGVHLVVDFVLVLLLDLVLNFLSCEVRACSWVWSFLSFARVCPAVGNALLLPAVGPLFCHPSRRFGATSITVFWISGIFALSSTILFPRPIFWLLVTRIIHLFVFTQSAGLSCARSPASLLASVSISPRERRTHTVFAVWCLGSSRSCGGSTSCSPVHVLTHVFSSVRFLHVLCVVWWSPELGSSRHGRGFRRAACCVAVLCVARNTSLLELLPRRSALCTFRRALLCSISRDRALGCSGSSSSRRHPSQVISLSTDAIVVWLSPLRPPGCSPAEALCDFPQLSPLRLAMCLVVSGHFSTQTCSN